MQTEDVEQFSLPTAFEPFFAGYADALQSLCLQEVAIASVSVINKIAISEIDLPIDISSIVPLSVSEFMPGHLLSELGATNDPFCFRVPKVKFKVLSEALI